MSKRNLAIITLALGLAAGAAWWFTLKPEQELQIANLSSDLTRLQNENTVQTQQRASAREEIPKLNAQLATLNAEHAHYTERIPTQENLPQLLAGLNTISDRNAVQYRGVQQGAKVQLIPGIYQVTHTLTTLGLFNDQVNFITDLQDLGRWVVVDTISLTRSGNDPRRPMINATITFRTFVNGDLTETDDEG